MASEKEIKEKGDQFLHALRPKPVPPASPVKSEDVSDSQVEHPRTMSPIVSDTCDTDEYMETFIYDHSNLNFRKSPRQVLVNRDMHELIQRITLLIGDNEISVAGYVNNVLALHLRQFDKLIHNLLKEKFNNKIP